MTLVYRSPINRDAETLALLFPDAVRNGVVLRASLTSYQDDEDGLPPLEADLRVNRERNGDYRFSIKASQPALELAHYEAMGKQASARNFSGTASTRIQR